MEIKDKTRDKDKEFKEIMECIFDGLRKILQPTSEEIQKSLSKLNIKEENNKET